MRISSYVCLALLAVGACSTSAPVTPTVQKETLRVLFIGNSLTYTNDLPDIVAQLAADDTVPIITGSVAYPNYSLDDHLAQGDAVQRIQSARWDVVVLQQGPSALPESRVALVAATRDFAPIIHDANAKVALFGVWPSSDRMSAFDSVTASYRNAADAVGGEFYPAGLAWTFAWERNPALPLFGPDGFHPSPMGSLLAALVIYRGLTGHALLDIPDHLRINGEPVSINDTDAPILLQAAARAYY